MAMVKRIGRLNKNVSDIAFSAGKACGVIVNKANESVARAKDAAYRMTNHKEYIVAQRVQKLSKILGTKKQKKTWMLHQHPAKFLSLEQLFQKVLCF